MSARAHTRARAGRAAGIVNLSNTIVGAGILGLPRAFSESGWFVGLLLLTLAAAGSALSLHLLAVSQETVGIAPSSFYTVAKASIPSFTNLIDVAVMIKCALGACCSPGLSTATLLRLLSAHL